MPKEQGHDTQGLQPGPFPFPPQDITPALASPMPNRVFELEGALKTDQRCYTHFTDGGSGAKAHWGLP